MPPLANVHQPRRLSKVDLLLFPGNISGSSSTATIVKSIRIDTNTLATAQDRYPSTGLTVLW